MTNVRTPQLVIVADDLTGAADSAARCVQAGLTAEIWLDTGSKSVDTQVVSVSTDSRFLLPEEAAQRVTQMMATMSAWTGVTWYKKIDSTLRGNLGAELDAMLTALPNMRAAIICPAFPAQGRGLDGGNLVFAGAPPRHLPALLREQSRNSVGVIDLASVRQGVNGLARVLQDRSAQGERLLVVDGTTDGDLETIVAAALVGDYLLCGSAGMVAPLASRWAKRAQDGAESSVAPGPILAVVGSGSQMAHAQVAHVATSGIMRVRTMDNTWYEVDFVGAESHPVGDWLIHMEPPPDDLPLDGAVARAQAARLADLAYAAVERLKPSVLLVVGGDTAYYVLRRLGIKRLSVTEELLPGIALTLGQDRCGHTRVVVLKPGNFGDAQTLVTLHKALRERQGIDV